MWSVFVRHSSRLKTMLDMDRCCTERYPVAACLECIRRTLWKDRRGRQLAAVWIQRHKFWNTVENPSFQKIVKFCYLCVKLFQIATTDPHEPVRHCGILEVWLCSTDTECEMADPLHSTASDPVQLFSAGGFSKPEHISSGASELSNKYWHLMARIDPPFQC